MEGEAKVAQSSRAGIYILQPNYVNGKEHWLQQGGSNALWYDKNYWYIGPKDDLGSSIGGLYGNASVSPLAATIWKYVKNDTWIEGTEEIVLSAGNSYLIMIL